MRQTSKIRLVVPTREQLKLAVASCGDSVLPEVLKRALSSRQLDTLLECVYELSIEKVHFRLSAAIVEHLKGEFALLGENTVLGYVQSWIAALRSSKRWLKSCCVLVDCVVRSVNLLQKSRLKEKLKVELPALHAEALSLGSFGAAILISRCFFHVLAVEASYEHDVDFGCLERCWDRILDNEASRKSPTVLLCSFLLATMLSLDGNAHMEAVVENEEEICTCEMTEDQHDTLFCPKMQFFSLLLANIRTVFANCSSSQSVVLMRALVNFYSERGSLHMVAASIYESLHLPNANSSSLCRHFFSCILQLFPDLFRQSVQEARSIEPLKVTCSFVDFGIWLSKISAMLADECNNDREVVSSSVSERSPEDVWVKVMSKYCKHLTLQSELDFLECSNTSRLMQAVNVILIDGQCPINAMPTVIGGALFGALLQLIVLIQDSLFSSILQSLVALFRWNGTYCRGLLARCGLKACKLFEVVARRGRSLNCISHTCVFLTDYLIASSSGSVFIEKCGGIMRVFSLDSADWILCSTLLSSVSGAFRTLDSKIILDDDASCASRFLEDHVVPLLNEQLNAFKSVDVDEANLNQLEAFALMLKVLRDLQMIERYLQIKLNIDEQIGWAVQMCKAICGRKRKLSNAERVYQNGRLIGAVVDFLTNQSRRDCLLKWKWLTSIVPYHKDVVERILSDATVDELQCLLRGDMAGYSEQRVLEVCAVIGSLQNDKKRRALLELFDPILRMMVNVVVDDARIVFMLLRSLFSQACGITNERRLLSLTLSFISVSLPSLDKADMIDDKYGELLIEISDTLSDCLRWCSSSVTEDQCALYAQLFVRAFRAVGLYALSSSFNAQLMVRNAHAISSVAYAIASHRTHFARIAPFIISECLSGVKYAPLAVHHLFGICDRYSIALLSTNLPPAQKRHFAQVYSSFYKANELTV